MLSTKVQEAANRIRRKVTIYIRRKAEAHEECFSPESIGQFRFYQFKASTAAFFYDRFGKTDIRVTDTPHFALASALLSGEAERIKLAKEYYVSYLTASWGTSKQEILTQRVERFRAHLSKFASNRANYAPVLTGLRAKGDLFVVDGNHRVAFALALGRHIRAEVWPVDLAFLRFSKMKGFYGTGHRSLPYQSIFIEEEEIIKGRRCDIRERIEIIPKTVICDRNILDIGCNIGMSSIVARSFGARTCLGLETSSDMVNMASRFAMFNSMYPAVRFQQFDIDQDELGGQFYDTAFVFSIWNHVERPDNLLRIAKNSVGKYVVFEGHPGADRHAYRHFFDSGIFKTVSEIGTLAASRFNASRNRILWLCEK